MDLDDELPRIQNQGPLKCIRNPVAVKQRRQDATVPVTKDWFGPVTRQNKQSTHQTMMKKGWNRCPTQKTKVMERMTPLERWNGLAWVCTVWLWKGLARGGVCSGTTVFPQTQHVRLVRFSLFGCDLTTSISSKGERTNRRLLRQLSKKYSTSRCFAQRSSRARGLLNGWIQTALKNWVSPKKGHQRSQSTGCVLVRKAPTKPVGHQHHRSKADSDGRPIETGC